MRTSSILVAAVIGLVVALQAKAYVYRSIPMPIVESAIRLCEKRSNLKKLYVVMSDMTFAVCGNGQKFKYMDDDYWQEVTRKVL